MGFAIRTSFKVSLEVSTRVFWISFGDRIDASCTSFLTLESIWSPLVIRVTAPVSWMTDIVR